VSDIIFYFGVIVIMIFYIGIVIKKFKDDDNIDLNEHKWIIIVYIILLVFSIITWRVLNLMIESKIEQINNYNQKIEELEYGKK